MSYIHTPLDTDALHSFRNDLYIRTMQITLKNKRFNIHIAMLVSGIGYHIKSDQSLQQTFKHTFVVRDLRVGSYVLLG